MLDDRAQEDQPAGQRVHTDAGAIATRGSSRCWLVGRDASCPGESDVVMPASTSCTCVITLDIDIRSSILFLQRDAHDARLSHGDLKAAGLPIGKAFVRHTHAVSRAGRQAEDIERTFVGGDRHTSYSERGIGQGHGGLRKAVDVTFQNEAGNRPRPRRGLGPNGTGG